MHTLISAICDILDSGRSFVLASICEHSGSTPRSSGAAMAVRPDGSIAGTIGGGLSEAQAIRQGVKLFDSDAPEGPAARIMRISLSNAEAAKAGMLCGGDMAVLLQRIDPGPANTAVFQKAREGLRAGKRVVLVSDLGPADQGDDMAPRGRTAVVEGEAPPALPEAVLAAAAEAGVPGMMEDGGLRFHLEPILARDAAYIIGAGHVAVPTARLTAMVGFRTVVMDDRPDFANAERFPDADEIMVLKDFGRCLAGQPVNRSTSLIIVTRGHLHDKTVLAEALRTPAGYVGMIGSKRKRDAIYDALLQEGFTQADIDRVHCPIGVPIDADTPEEIAVSIVGELIMDRAGRRSAP